MKRSIFTRLLALSCSLGLAFLLLGADLSLHLAGASLNASERRVFATLQSQAQEVAHLTALGLLEPSGAGSVQLAGRYRELLNTLRALPPLPQDPVQRRGGGVLLRGPAPVGPGRPGGAPGERARLPSSLRRSAAPAPGENKGTGAAPAALRDRLRSAHGQAAPAGRSGPGGLRGRGPGRDPVAGLFSFAGPGPRRSAPAALQPRHSPGDRAARTGALARAQGRDRGTVRAAAAAAAPARRPGRPAGAGVRAAPPAPARRKPRGDRCTRR